MIRIVVVDKVLLMCEVIAAAINQEKDIRVVDIATNAKEALGCVEESCCNLILVSASLGDGAALELIECIRQKNPDIKVVAIGMANSEAVILSYIEAGISGYVLTEDPLDKLLANIRAAYENKALITPEVAAVLMERISTLSAKLMDIEVDPKAYEELTPRERETLELIADGHTNREIAEKLTVELGTVKNHVHNILKKLSVHSRKDAAAYLALMEQIKNRETNGSQLEAA